MTQTNIANLLQQAKEASRNVALLSDETINQVLNDVAAAAEAHADEILAANALDLQRMDSNNPMYDRLKLTSERLAGIAADQRHVATLPSPLHRVLSHSILPNGLDLSRVSVPFGVIGVVYEARPNVTFDVFSLTLKAGSACVLKGGKDADESNRAIAKVIHDVLRKHGINTATLTLLPATHDATAQLLHANGLVDVVIPRGSKRLIDFVRTEASVPVIETGAGVCHAYFDQEGDLTMGARIIHNAKTRRVSVCNALDCLIIHSKRLSDLPALLQPMQADHVRVYADTKSYDVLQGNYPAELLHPADGNTFGTEFQDYAMAVKTVDNIDEALNHIQTFGSGHSECIITQNQQTADLFLQRVDAACVYHNAPTSFTDGAQFGLGAEIGISTQKLHARGPMALEAMTTYKWIVRGNGQVRPK